jgi:hypothetical protein
MAKGCYLLYPLLVGVLLGLIQTGLFFQLTFTLSSGFATYLLVTLCWLVGSALGVLVIARGRIPVGAWLAVALAAYGLCAVLLGLAPFETGLSPIYAALVGLAGVYPGVFFARMSAVYRARTLFLWENNGFILGLALGTLLFLLIGRAALWIAPLLVAAAVSWLGARQHAPGMP